MTNRSISIDASLHHYLLAHNKESEVLRRLREETSHLELARMQIGPDQGAFMAWVVRLTRAQTILEIGTFTGYSAIAMAAAMSPQGTLITCDIEETTTDVAKRYARDAGVDTRLDFRIAPAMETLNALRAGGHDESFDLVFIDADKENYDGYYEQSLALLRTGGVIILDNVLWDGKVADPSHDDLVTESLRAIGKKIHQDPRVDACMIPVGDGLSLVQKRDPSAPSQKNQA